MAVVIFQDAKTAAEYAAAMARCAVDLRIEAIRAEAAVQQSLFTATHPVMEFACFCESESKRAAGEIELTR